MTDLSPGARVSVVNPNKVVAVSAPGLVKSILLKEGPPGQPGAANALTIGTVVGGDTADASLTGTAPNQVLNLTLPKGDQGDPSTVPGPAGPGVPAGGATGYSLVKASATDYDTAWQAPASSGPLLAYKAADTSRTSTTTLANDPDLTLPVVANGVYIFELFLLETTSGAATFKALLTAPSGSTAWVTFRGRDVSDIEHPSKPAWNFVVTEATGSSGTAASPALLHITGTLAVGASSGNAVLQWAQRSSNATATILKAGSWLRLTKLN